MQGKIEEKDVTHVSKNSTLALVQSALLVAFLALGAQVTVALGPVPFTLQTIFVALIALLFPPKQAALTVLIYLLMGAFGLPVFAGAKGGLASLMGPTGGFLWGFVLAASLGSLARLALASAHTKSLRAKPMAGDILAVIIVMIVSYACGLIQLMYVGNMGFVAAFGLAVLPFIVLDALKSAVAIVIAMALRKALVSMEL
ncbi:MAG: biotin transporter BioY [Coriobacteriia bacterium]|nr:biotin transporter BioY [Coriobacteriia bacterium]